MQLELSDRQRRTVAAAVTILGAFVILCAVGALFWLVAVFLRSFSGVLLPLAVAGVGALVLKPLYDLLHSRLRLPAGLALVALFLLLLLPIVSFSWFFGHLVVDQTGELATRAPAWWKTVSDQVSQRWPQVVEFLEHHPMGQRLRQTVEGQQEALLAGLQNVGGRALSAGAGVLRGLGGVFSWAVLPVYLAFFLIGVSAEREGGRLEQMLPFLKAETRRDLVYLVREFVEIVVAFFRGQLLIAFAMGLLLATGFSLVGLRYGLVLGLVLGLLNIIPYLGSIVGLAVTLPLAFFQAAGGLTKVVAVLVVFTLVQMIEGYVLTPKIMGDRTGLHPMVIIVAVFFWGSALDGILGMILAIPLTAFLVVFWRLAREKYIAELV